MGKMSLFLSSPLQPSYTILSKPSSSLPFNPLSRAAAAGVCSVTGRPSKPNSIGSVSAPGLVCRPYKRKVAVPRGRSVVCAAAPATSVFSPQTLHWISTVASVILMFSRSTPVQKSLLPPFFALQAPHSVISWIKGEYGHWTTFLGLLVRLFYNIPGEVELPFLSMLLTIVAPSQTTNLRGTPAGAIVSLVIAGYLAYQHFSKTGSLENAFDQGSIIPTLALISSVAVPCLLLFLY